MPCRPFCVAASPVIVRPPDLCADSVEVGQELDPSASLPVTLVEPDMRFARIRRSDVLSWMGGTGAVHKTDWHCLEGRHVILWPDADDPGRKAMANLTGTASKAKAEAVQIVKPEPDRKDGWDVADAIEEGVDVADYIEQRAGEPEPDPLDNLIEKTKTDPGAPFEPDMLARLSSNIVYPRLHFRSRKLPTHYRTSSAFPQTSHRSR